MIFHSIRWRLQLWHGIILFVVLAGFGLTAYRFQHANELRRVDQELHQRLGPVLDALRRPPPGGPGRPGEPKPGGFEPDERVRRGPPPRQTGGEFPPPLEFRLGPNRGMLFEGDTNAFYYVVWLRDGREIGRSASAPSDVIRPERVGGMRQVPTIHGRGMMRELHQFIPGGECVLVGRSIAPELANLRQFAVVLSGLGGAILVLGLAGGWWLATRAIRPIDDISAAAARIATGDLSHRINTDDTDNELGQLAGVLNSTFARLEAAFVRQQQFTADASHELRTPIAVILSQAQATLARERTPGEYRETIEACQRAAQRMRTLTESLLALARLDAGQERMNCQRFDLSQTTRDCVALLGSLAGERGITIRCELAAAECFGDPERLGQVVTNLLTNAILHNKNPGEVSVTTREENDFAVLIIADAGPGISAEDLPRVFDRFYRADTSRTGATGGTGLGLAICKAIADAHGGTLEAASTLGQGSTFTLRIPGLTGQQRCDDSTEPRPDA
jgi:two-component system, OmpR family, sensor kinase